MSDGKAEWLTSRERGSIFAMRLLLWSCALVGRGGLRLLLRLIALFYALVDARARASSRQYLRRVLPAEPSFGDIYRHLFCFAQCATDRYFLLSGKTRGLRFTYDGHHHLEALKAQKKGALLVGAHLGSFEAMRAASVNEEIAIKAMMHLGNARKVSAFLDEVAPGFSRNMIEIKPGSLGHVAQARDAVRQGALVALLADRTGLNDRSVEVDFFGQKAPLPAGPFLMAAVLRCPVYLTFGLFHPPGSYDLYCEPFLDEADIPPGRPSDEWAQQQAQRYAKRLEHYCRMAPYNWFNFFDFWRPSA